MYASAFTAGDADRWDELVEASPMGTLLHTRRFLTYHGSRFEDRSVLLLDDQERLAGVFPAAVDPDDDSCVISHPGATYGGLVFDDRSSRGEVARELLAATFGHLRVAGHSRLVYRAVPPHLHVHPCQQDLYAIWRCAGRLVRRELWSVVDLSGVSAAHAGRTRSINKARRKGVTVVRDDSDASYATFAAMLERRLAEQHDVAPVHSLEEMLQLRGLLGPKVQLWIAHDDAGVAIAGAWMFELSATALHAQYMATTAAGRRVGAGEVLLDELIGTARADAKRCFSFGTSAEADGTVLNEGLFAYKAAFGAGSVAQDFYEIDLVPGNG